MNDADQVQTTSVFEVAGLARAVLDPVGTVVVGKRDALELVLAGILAGGHVLLEDLPGLGKTLTARSFAQALGLDFRRLQFTPDLLPADVTGSFLYDQRTRDFTFRAGPVFTNLLLADEINRTPPKTQAALLEAMQEKQVSVEGVTYRLDPPFHVLATANPIEYEGTYPLPEAQLDRFLLRVSFGYPTRDEEWEVLRRRMSRRQEEAELDAGRRRRARCAACRPRWRTSRSRTRSAATSSTLTAATREHAVGAGRRLAPRLAGAAAAGPGGGRAGRPRLSSSRRTSRRSRCPRWRTGSRCARRCGCAGSTRPSSSHEVLDRTPAPASGALPSYAAGSTRGMTSRPTATLRAAVPQPRRGATGGVQPAPEWWTPTRALGRAVLLTGLLLMAGVLLGRVDLVVLAAPFALGTAFALRRRPPAAPGSGSAADGRAAWSRAAQLDRAR